MPWKVETRDLARQRFAARDDVGNALAHPVEVPQRACAEGFRDDADAAWGADPTEGGTDPRPGEGVATPPPRQSERLAQGADHHQVGKSCDQASGCDGG